MHHSRLTPRIELSAEMKLVGKRLTMSFADYKIGVLWQSFLPRRHEITNNVSNNLISLVMYASNHFTDFKPTNEFERWAAIAVADFDKTPTDMDTYVLQSGLYAVFDYKGLNTDNSIYQYIFGTWIPSTDYALDNRPHFEILGDMYKNNDPTSEEEIWIPIKPR